MSARAALVSGRPLPGSSSGVAKGPGSVGSGAGSVVSKASSSATADCLCICNICTCGHHSCPKPAPRVPFNGSSTYADDYPAYPVCQVHGPVPMQWQPSGIPFEGTSEARAAYTGKQLPPGPSPYSGLAMPDRPKVPFTGSSTYKSDYPAHELCPLHAPPGFDAAQWKPSGIPFDGTTTHREAFGAKPLEPRRYEGMPEYKPSAIPFSGTSESRSQYQAWELPKREGGSGEMLGAAPRPHIPFDATSTSKDHYKAWELPKREGMSPAEWAALTAARPHIPFDGRTTAQEAYTAKPLERPPTAPVGYSYAPVPDNRDFKSESRAQHDWKEPEPICPAALLPPPPPASSGTWSGKPGHALWDPVKQRWLHNH